MLLCSAACVQAFCTIITNWTKNITCISYQHCSCEEYSPVLFLCSPPRTSANESTAALQMDWATTFLESAQDAYFHAPPTSFAQSSPRSPIWETDYWIQIHDRTYNAPGHPFGSKMSSKLGPAALAVLAMSSSPSIKSAKPPPKSKDATYPSYVHHGVSTFIVRYPQASLQPQIASQTPSAKYFEVQIAEGTLFNKPVIIKKICQIQKDVTFIEVDEKGDDTAKRKGSKKRK